MGVFDFIKNAGAKVGIGKSTDEEAAEQAAIEAEAAKRAKEETMRRGAIKQAQAAQKAADERAEARAEAAAEKADSHARVQAAAKERMAEYRKSAELEKYVGELGIDISGVDIRFDDGTAYISGEATDSATRERIILAVGNAQGVGRVDEEISVADPSEGAEFHTVVAGDTLWAIADRVYGDGSRYNEIFEANKPMLSDPNLIFPGQVLRCPK